ncbi:Trimethylguanosine synthase [Boothiomyces sp. JEL0866]|nr:Trimethylguanosine synthase [Boothiomyces sp. JEL0866]
MKSKAQKRRERRFKLQQANSDLQSCVDKYLKSHSGALGNALDDTGNSLQSNNNLVENAINKITMTPESDTADLSDWSLERLPKNMHKYFHQRYSLFSLFDHIKIDMEGWFSVTPEQIAIHLANRLKGGTVIDAFCGVGGNTIQFSKVCSKVIAIDNNKTRLECAKHNARVYGCTNIEFILGDYMQLDLQADKVFLSPPWGGISYNQSDFSIDQMPIKGTEIFKRTKKITDNICFFLPRNIQKPELMFEDVEFEETFLDGKLKSYSVYYGNLINRN